MAGWGTGSFENEEAQNWLKNLKTLGLDDLSEIFSAVDPAGYLEAPAASIVIAGILAATPILALSPAAFPASHNAGCVHGVAGARYNQRLFNSLMRRKDAIAERFLHTYNVNRVTMWEVKPVSDDVICERAFLPDKDELAEYRASRTPLLSLESQRPVADFDVIAFSVSFESDYANIPDLLTLAGLPCFAGERTAAMPLVMAGGAALFLNPEPVAERSNRRVNRVRPAEAVVGVARCRCSAARKLCSSRRSPPPRPAGHRR